MSHPAFGVPDQQPCVSRQLAAELAARAELLRSAASTLTARVAAMQWSGSAGHRARSEVAELVALLRRDADRHQQYAARCAATSSPPR